jgi:hypothetical protein
MWSTDTRGRSAGRTPAEIAAGKQLKYTHLLSLQAKPESSNQAA